MKPVTEEIQKEREKVKVLFIDADVNKELMIQHQIKGVPGFIIFKNNREVFRHLGMISKEGLLKQLN